MLRTMKPQLDARKLLVKKSTIQGYGVFADEDIQPNMIIEEGYLLETEGRDIRLANYIFGYDQKSLLALGFGSIYNHSEHPNADYVCDPVLSIITFRANRFIKRGEEIFISYGKEWFSSRQMRPKKPSPWLVFRRLAGVLLRFTIVLAGMLTFMVLLKTPLSPLKFF